LSTAPISCENKVIQQTFLRALRIDRRALLWPKNENPRRDDEGDFEGQNDCDVTSKGMLEHVTCFLREMAGSLT
jgi:hypothetical protein